jgi:glucose/arabinose dehydrogenase
MIRARPALLMAAAPLLLAACAAGGGGSAPPTWMPVPTFGPAGDGPGAQASPIIPLPSAPGGSTPSQSPGGTGSTPSRTRTGDPNVVATHLRAPIGLIMLPDGTALVGERSTGRIVHVQPKPGQPVPTVRVIHGLDTAGGGGLLDLALSPTYAEDGLIYAYVTTPADNRVVDFTLNGPVTPVLTGIPRGPSGNAGRIVFGGDGDLYVGTGNAGDAALAANPRSLAGKVLRVNDIGDPAPRNPVASSPIYTSGQHALAGLCSVPNSTNVLEVDGGPPATINLLRPGAFFGFPRSANRLLTGPLLTVPDRYRAPGGCAVQGGRLWLTSLNGRALVAVSLRGPSAPPGTSPFASVLAKRYGRLKTVVAADDGALWLTTSNRDGFGHPVPADERVIRYLPNSSDGASPF